MSSSGWVGLEGLEKGAGKQQHRLLITELMGGGSQQGTGSKLVCLGGMGQKLRRIVMTWGPSQEFAYNPFLHQKITGGLQRRACVIGQKIIFPRTLLLAYLCISIMPSVLCRNNQRRI